MLSDRSPYTLPRLDAKQVRILIAISLAAAITTFYTRLLSTSLPDLRGAWELFVDEGSMLCVAATVSQMLIAGASMAADYFWLPAHSGTRRCWICPGEFYHSLSDNFFAASRGAYSPRDNFRLFRHGNHTYSPEDAPASLVDYCLCPQQCRG